MKEAISVIIPVHNSEKYLSECIDSVISQTFVNLEIILVDDGSTDRSGVICDDYAKKDNRIIVIHKKGEGGAKARNTGIGVATGNYFYFMDSDDYLEKEALEQLYEMMRRENSQCVCSSFHYIDQDGEELPWRTPELEKYQTMTGREAASVFLTTLDIEGFSWNKLFKRELIVENNIHFDEQMNSFVDMYGMFRAILSSNRVSFINKKFYYYRQHAISIVHTMDRRKLNNYRRAVGQIVDEAKKNNLYAESDFFYVYRMAMQLFDTVRDKKKYNREVWEGIEKDYKWEEIFTGSFSQTLNTILHYLKRERVKTIIKLICVRINF